MKKNSFIVKLQNVFGVSQSELFIAFVILAGLLIGSVARFFDNDKDDAEPDRDEIYFILDSLAEAQKTTFIGTDLSGNYDEELAKADTVIKKQPSPPSTTKIKPSENKININTASKLVLMKLPQVGDKTAQSIIDYRKNSPFTTIEEIMNVKGIGQKKFDKMKDYISVK